ncbi:MAG TPA: arylsulfatase, partial [Tepidisphaeraceae bacterium]|nr:arylsulfatase [Tepidisphaeraceae bacterium]
RLYALPILFLLLVVSLSLRAAEKPDIVFILSDDQGSYDVSWRGSEIKTPNLDKLADAGIKLENFYVQPLCSPTRAALMTGRYPMRHGLQVGIIGPNADFGLPLEERTLPQALRGVGYTTAICGKWHLGSVTPDYYPNHRGFDHWYGHLFGQVDYFTHIRQGKFDWWRDGQPCHDEGYTTHLVGDEAAKRIRAQPKDKPLFLYVPFNAVHSPYEVPDKYREPYKQLPEKRQIYAGMVAAMDENVGKIVGAIDDTGRRKNTLFIFSSDNGGPQPGTITSNGPLRAGKGSVYEGGVHTCAFVTWDDHIKPGTTTRALSHISDWYPTLLNLTGASLEQKLPLDGKDIWPCLTEGKPSPRTEVLMNTTPDHGALRIGDWKIVLHNLAPRTGKRAKSAEPKIELFNLAEDLSEKTNLSESNPKKLKELRARYDVLAAEAVPPKNKPGEKGED